MDVSKIDARVLEEALLLSSEILKNIELSEIPLANICLKTMRLARLLGHTNLLKIFQLEVSGYPHHPEGMPKDLWDFAKVSGRTYKTKLVTETKEYMFIESIETLEGQVQTSQVALQAAGDPNISLSSANPNQFLHPPLKNAQERQTLINTVTTAKGRISSRRAFIYRYVAERYVQLKFSSKIFDLFSEVRSEVDQSLNRIVASSQDKLESIQVNLQSKNPEDWANAVHTCRKLLQDTADAVYPARDEPKKKQVNGKEISIALGADNFINRLVCFVEDNVASDTYASVVGSHLGYLGDRLDAIFSATQKGSHSPIKERSEADRYCIYTYLILGDILRLKSPGEPIPRTEGSSDNPGTDTTDPQRK